MHKEEVMTFGLFAVGDEVTVTKAGQAPKKQTIRKILLTERTREEALRDKRPTQERVFIFRDGSCATHEDEVEKSFVVAAPTPSVLPETPVMDTAKEASP